jgi:hypothetical protein
VSRNDDAAREPLTAAERERVLAQVSGVQVSPRAADRDTMQSARLMTEEHATQAAAIARLEGDLASEKGRAQFLEDELDSREASRDLFAARLDDANAQIRRLAAALEEKRDRLLGDRDRARNERDRAVLDAQAARRERDALKAGIEAALSEAWGRPMVRFNARKALRSLLAPTPSAPSEPLGNNDWRIDLWDAINEYATACGGDPGANVYGNTRRQRAVAAVERAARYATEPEAPSERSGYSVPALPTDPDYEDQLDALLASKSQGVRKVRPSERGAAGDPCDEEDPCYPVQPCPRHAKPASAPPPVEPRDVIASERDRELRCTCAARGGALCECTAEPRAVEAARVSDLDGLRAYVRRGTHSDWREALLIAIDEAERCADLERRARALCKALARLGESDEWTEGVVSDRRKQLADALGEERE